MPNVATPPDILYQKSRDDLLTWEDLRASSLFAGVPNFYAARNSQTLWGNFVEAVAQELARLDYLFAYEIVNKNPQYLTPADIRRRWAEALHVSGDYPTASQTDQDYKLMLMRLLPAYRQGATVAALNNIVQAYLGTQTANGVTIKELFDDSLEPTSSRNTVAVTANVGGTSPFASYININQLQYVANDLYVALSRGKPAHVGLRFEVLFGQADSMAAVIATFSDALTITFAATEKETTTMLVLAPSTDATPLGAYGETVGDVLSKYITATQYGALPYATFQAEYDGPDSNGNYMLDPANYADVALTSGPGITYTAWQALSPADQAAYTQGADGNYYPFTGEIQKGAGELGPDISGTNFIKSDKLQIIEVT